MNVPILAPNWLDLHVVNVSSHYPVVSGKPCFASRLSMGDGSALLWGPPSMGDNATQALLWEHPVHTAAILLTKEFFKENSTGLQR